MAVFAWGVAGVAWATVISLFVSALLLLVHLGRAEGAWRFQLLVRSESADGKTSLPSLLRSFFRACPPPSGVTVTPTIDPVSFL